MGAGASAGGVALPFESAEAALGAGKTQREINDWRRAHPMIEVYPDEDSDESGEEMTDVVIHIGEKVCTFGVAGQKTPPKTFPSHVDGKYAVQSGIITDWDVFEKIVAKSYYDLDLASECCQTLIMDSAANAHVKANREKIVQVMFETFSVFKMGVMRTPHENDAAAKKELNSRGEKSTPWHIGSFYLAMGELFTDSSMMAKGGYDESGPGLCHRMFWRPDGSPPDLGAGVPYVKKNLLGGKDIFAGSFLDGLLA